MIECIEMLVEEPQTWNNRSYLTAAIIISECRCRARLRSTIHQLGTVGYMVPTLRKHEGRRKKADKKIQGKTVKYTEARHRQRIMNE